MFVGAFLAKPATAGVIISVDWDSTLAGIQSTIAAKPGDAVTANIIFEITGATAIGNYEMSTRFSSSGLTFVSRVDTGPASLPIVAVNPPSSVNFNTQNTGLSTPALGVYGVNGRIAGANLNPGTEPTSSTPPFSVSTLNFIVGADANGMVLTPGIFNLSRDAFFDNNFTEIPLNQFVFNSGSITAVPEPSAAALASFGLLAIGVGGYRNRRSLLLQV